MLLIYHIITMKTSFRILLLALAGGSCRYICNPSANTKTYGNRRKSS